jgi:hypothetical protein
MSQEVFINAAEHITPVGAPLLAEGSANTFRMGFLSWGKIIGKIIELHCACAFQVITSFAEQVIPQGHSWEMDVDRPMDPPEPEPVDLSDARGWELAFSLTRTTEASLLAAFRAVPRADPYYGCIAANALQVLDTMIFTTAFRFFQFETFLKGLHLESMKSAEIAARQMEAFPAEQFVTTPVYVLFL